jgi:hypothetical protein
VGTRPCPREEGGKGLNAVPRGISIIRGHSGRLGETSGYASWHNNITSDPASDSILVRHWALDSHNLHATLQCEEVPVVSHHITPRYLNRGFELVAGCVRVPTEEVESLTTDVFRLCLHDGTFAGVPQSHRASQSYTVVFSSFVHYKS